MFICKELDCIDNRHLCTLLKPQLEATLTLGSSKKQEYSLEAEFIITAKKGTQLSSLKIFKTLKNKEVFFYTVLPNFARPLLYGSFPGFESLSFL
jgi:hypothetical protein